MEDSLKWTTKEFNELLYFFRLTDLSYENAWKREGTKKPVEQQDTTAESTALLPKDESSIQMEHEQDPLELKGIIDHLIAASPHSTEALSVSKETFKPPIFLQEIHRETSYSQLLEGMSNLEVTIQHRTERLSEAVKRNFTRFVGARNKATEIQRSLRNKEMSFLFEQLKAQISGKKRIFSLPKTYYSALRNTSNCREAFFSFDNLQAERRNQQKTCISS